MPVQVPPSGGTSAGAWPLDHVSPLAVPVLLEIGREQVHGQASDELLAQAEAELVKEAMQ